MVNQSQFIEKTTSSSSPLISLKEVVSIVRKNVNPTSGKTYTLYSFPAYDNQKIPEIVDGGEIRSCKLDLTPNTVLYNKLNVRLCRVWNIREIATTNNICSTEFIPLKMDESVLLQEYLVYFLTSEAVTKAMVGVSQGTSNSQKRIAPEALLKLEIPLPPTEVQKEFVAVYRKSDKSKFAGFKSQFIEMFASCPNKSFIGDVVEVLDDKRKPINDSVRQRMKTGALYPYYGATGQVDSINDYLTDETLLCIAEDCGNYDAGEESSYIIHGKAWVNNHAHLVRPKSDICDITYLHYFLTISDLNEYVSGTTRKKMTQGSLVRVPVLLPAIDEQQRFATVVEHADKSKYLN